ncbi:ArnT family glycosyltransferase [Oricola cellulosilytica]|uniref:Phospholipid carrier-dependent glycosyltransferase n=1 Tax=Oricola cellulosilytica TaxID=1429082 RepID=A0A4R0PCH1_9HYPH|nr:glycosyltransferase family 39 protein [Oricola cellulosilytica]TCD13878.1 phospholipid carrier-dependent glycosyltransferase [Oricola cellulosilytica]
MAIAIPKAPSTLTPARETHLLILAIVLIALFALRAMSLALSSTSLGFDEAQYWAWSQNLTLGYFTKPPLIAWLIGGTTTLCGDGALCVRMPANLLHIASSVLAYAAGRQLYDWRVGFWSAIVYATIPGVAVSSYLMTTDVPLIFFWFVALIAFHAHLHAPRLATGMALGLAVGLGLNAKYAMIFFVLCAVLYVAATRPSRKVVAAPSTWLALAIAALLIAPNMLWNLSNGFATFEHTVNDNMEWGGLDLHPKDALEFLVTQFGVLGPVIFGAYLVLLFTGRRTDKPESDRFLLFLSLPVFLLITLQALMSQAEANWSATAFPAAVILTTAHLLIPRYSVSFLASLAINGAIALFAIGGIMMITPANVPAKSLRPVHQIFGGEDLRNGLIAALEPAGVETVVAEGRAMTAEVIHALRGTYYDVRALVMPGAAPSNDFEKTRPWTPDMALPVILVRGAGSGEPEFLSGRKSLIGIIESPSLKLRYGVLNIWKVEPPETGSSA